MKNKGMSLIAWEMIYRTVLDCHKVAIGDTKHFLYGTKYRHTATENDAKIIERERKELEQWIRSDRFKFYAQEMGFDHETATQGALAVLDGSNIEKNAELLKQIKEKHLRENTKHERSKRNTERRANSKQHSTTASATDPNRRNSGFNFAAIATGSERTPAGAGAY